MTAPSSPPTTDWPTIVPPITSAPPQPIGVEPVATVGAAPELVELPVTGIDPVAGGVLALGLTLAGIGCLIYGARR